MQLLNKIIDRLKRRFISYYANAPFRIPVIGAIGVIGFPLYYVVWTWISPESYENLYLRMIAAVVCAGAALSGSWKHLLPRFFYVYNFCAIVYCLPFFFFYMLFRDDFSYIWSMSAIASLLIMALLFDTVNLCIGVLIGVLSAYAAYCFSTGQTQLDDKVFLAMPVMAFTLVIIRTLLSYNDSHVEKMKIKTAKALAGHIAHEMRTPLLGIQLDAKKSKKIIETAGDFRNKPLVVKSFDRILSHATGANLVIDMLLTNAREIQAQKESFIPIEIGALVEAIYDSYHFKSDESERVSINIKSNFTFLGSDVLVRHVIYNLLKNAIKAIKEVKDGHIEISMDCDDVKGFVSVLDNGPGVPLAFQSLLFTPFHTTSKDDTGTGLGLAFCSMVIEDLSGSIDYADSLCGGAEFTITLPLVNELD